MTETERMVAEWLAKGNTILVIPENIGTRGGSIVRTRRPTNEYLARSRAEQFFVNINKRV